MKRQYKIKLNSIASYDVFYSFWWLPFWIKSNSWIHTFKSIDEAKIYIEKLKKPVYL